MEKAIWWKKKMKKKKKLDDVRRLFKEGSNLSKKMETVVQIFLRILPFQQTFDHFRIVLGNSHEIFHNLFLCYLCFSNYGAYKFLLKEFPHWDPLDKFRTKTLVKCCFTKQCFTKKVGRRINASDFLTNLHLWALYPILYYRSFLPVIKINIRSTNIRNNMFNQSNS